MKNFDFASPSQYSDWAQYAGFNRTTGEVEGMQAPQKGVAPPENISDYMSQRFAPVVGQLATGNVMGAANTMRQARNPAQATAPVSTVAPMLGYDYTHGLDF